jgi:cobalamin biosynthesis Mg chelatase CobN
MRWSTIFTLLVSLFLLGTLAAPASGLDQRDAVANIQARQDAESATAENTASEASTTGTRKDATSTATDASTTPQATATGNHISATASMNATTTATAASATSTVPSLDGATASSQQEAADSTRPTYSGGLPIQPIITPAFGVGGFILMALGAVLTFIGVRKQWYGIYTSCF